MAHGDDRANEGHARPGGAPHSVRHPLFARVCAGMSALEGRSRFADYRREQLEGISGRVVEIGCGSGVHFRHYRPPVTAVTAAEPEPYLRRLALRAASRAAVPVSVIDAVAERLPFPDGAFDVGVSSLVLCTVTDPQAAVAELWRVIRPGGELRLLEHVRAAEVRLARRQARADRWLWPRLAGGCHCCRDTAATVAAGGFRMERLRALTIPAFWPFDVVSPAIIATARRLP